MCVRKPLNKENKEGLMGEESISTANVKACFLSVRVLRAHVHAKLRLTLCDPMDCGPLGASVLGILQARILEWLPCPPPGDLPDPGIEAACLCLLYWQAGSLPLASLCHLVIKNA